MLNRRHLRIKILQALYAYYQNEDRDLAQAEKQLYFSIDKMYEMYLYLLLLVVEMQGKAIEKIEAGRNKRLPAQEDLHPNTKFVTNAPLRVLANSKKLAALLNEKGISWSDNPDLVKTVFKEISQTEEYKEYMDSAERGFTHDRDYLLKLFKRHMINIEGLHEYFEEKSIFWNDDLDLMAGMVIKTIKLVEENADDFDLLPLWKDPADEKDFVSVLFRNTVVQGEDNEKLIDMILMKMALTEAQSFESIPLKVSLNEYIELSKYYSTPKSNGFINGILDQLYAKLKEDGSIKKVGRGLID
jgi:N utilization substance protein B